MFAIAVVESGLSIVVASIVAALVAEDFAREVGNLRVKPFELSPSS